MEFELRVAQFADAPPVPAAAIAAHVALFKHDAIRIIDPQRSVLPVAPELLLSNFGNRLPFAEHVIGFAIAVYQPQLRPEGRVAAKNVAISANLFCNRSEQLSKRLNSPLN